MRKSGEKGFFKRVAACACSGLLFVTCEDLEARARECGSEGSEACLATLLAFINDGEPDFGDEVGDGGVGCAKLAKSEAMSENKTTERRVVLEELSTISRHVVDGRGSSEGSSYAPSILLSSRGEHLGGDHKWCLQRWQEGGLVQRK